MSVFAPKTKAEQRVDHYAALKRPLTDSESDDLRRALHAVYVHDRKQSLLAMNREEELRLIEKLRQEAAQPEWYPA